MHVTPMWIPMMMPVVDVLLLCSSFRQSHGGFSTGRRGSELVLFLMLLRSSIIASPMAQARTEPQEAKLRSGLWQAGPIQVYGLNPTPPLWGLQRGKMCKADREQQQQNEVGG